jgi:hypothetical protein
MMIAGTNKLTLAEIARALNGTVNGKWINVRGPGHSGQDRSLGIKFDPNALGGFIVRSFADDDRTECRAYVKSLLQKLNGGFYENCEPKNTYAENDPVRIKGALALWTQAKSPKGTITEAYFSSRRCHFEPVLGADVIRFHPNCPFGGLRVPAMLALITDAITGEPIGVHRTAINDDGSGKRFGKDSKMVLGVARRGVIRLNPASECMGIAEGVESALSAAQVFGTPVWAAMSAGGIAAFPILKGIKRLSVFADHDNAGIKAALKCGRRYEMSGITGEIHIPPVVKSDWNDWLMEQGR